LTGLDEQQRGKFLASVHHQLGNVAQAQRQLSQAEQYYQEALRIKVEFNDRYSQAATYNQLANVAQLQENGPQARDYGRAERSAAPGGCRELSTGSGLIDSNQQKQVTQVHWVQWVLSERMMAPPTG
jgi:hypothetical protein